MICIQPQLSINISCLKCNQLKVIVDGIHLIGVHYLAKCLCPACNTFFYHTLPTGHTLRYPISITSDCEYVKQLKNCNLRWIVDPLKNAITNPNKSEILIEKKTYFSKQEIILLNCIDHLYGHVLLKILNAQYYIESEKDKGLILIIPKGFEWFVPVGVAEVWTVSIPMSKARQWHIILDKFFHDEISKYEKVFLSLAFPLPNPSIIDIEKFTKTHKFNLEKFEKQTPQITFIYREDRLWLRSHLLDNISVIAKEYKIKPLCFVLIQLQNIKIKKLLIQIKRKLPQAKITITGMGKQGHFPNFINDLRFKDNRNLDEIKLCKLYASSHLVIGLHGSNMLLPTALSAAYIEILPKNRLGNILQDILQPYNGRDLHYLGRFVSNKNSASDIAYIAYMLISRYQAFTKGITQNYLQHGLFDDVSKWEQMI